MKPTFFNELTGGLRLQFGNRQRNRRVLQCTRLGGGRVMSERGPQHQSWYLARDGRQLGPYAGEELLRLAEAGQLRRDDLIWRPGFAAWKPIYAVSGLLTPPSMPGPPSSGVDPPPPPSLQQQSLPPEPEPASAGAKLAGVATRQARQQSAASLAPGAAERVPAGSSLEWIERLPYRWARNGAIAGAIVGLPYIAIDQDGVYWFAVIAALVAACAIVAGFFSRDRLMRMRALGEAEASAAIDALPARYAAWGAGLGAISRFLHGALSSPKRLKPVWPLPKLFFSFRG